jgi:hypothetical protein
MAITARDVLQMIGDAKKDYKKLISALELVMRDLEYVADVWEDEKLFGVLDELDRILAKVQDRIGPRLEKILYEAEREFRSYPPDEEF